MDVCAIPKVVLEGRIVVYYNVHNMNRKERQLFPVF